MSFSYGTPCRICVVQIPTKKLVLQVDHTYLTAPGRHHELDHTDFRNLPIYVSALKCLDNKQEIFCWIICPKCERFFWLPYLDVAGSPPEQSKNGGTTKRWMGLRIGGRVKVGALMGTTARPPAINDSRFGAEGSSQQ